MHIDDNADVDAAPMSGNDFVDEGGVSEGEESNAKSLVGVADFFAHVCKSMATRIWQEPEFEILPSDHGLEITGRMGSFIDEEAGDFLTFKADDEIVVHGKRSGGHVRRADKDSFFVENEDFLMHEAEAMNGMEFGFWKGIPEIGRAVGIIIDNGGHGLVGQGIEDGGVAEPKHDEVDRLVRFSDGVNESKAQVLLSLVGVEAGRLIAMGLIGREGVDDEPNTAAENGKKPKGKRKFGLRLWNRLSNYPPDW